MANVATQVGTAPRTRGRSITGRALSGIAILALALDAGAKLLLPSLMIAHSPPLGIPADIGFYRLLGTILAISVAFYVWPRTSFLGAVLVTGYLGGAIAINLRAAMPFSHTMFALFLGLLVWVGLWLRDARLRGLFA